MARVLFPAIYLTLGLIKLGLCAVPEPRYANHLYVEIDRDTKNFLIGYYPTVEGVTEKDLGNLAYRAAVDMQQMVTDKKLRARASITVWQDNKNDIYIASSGGGDASDATEVCGESNIVTASKSKFYGAQENGLKGGKVIIWSVKAGRYQSVSSDCETKFVKPAEAADIYPQLEDTRPRPPKPVQGYDIYWDLKKGIYYYRNQYDYRQTSLIKPPPAAPPVLPKGWVMFEDLDNQAYIYRDPAYNFWRSLPTDQCYPRQVAKFPKRQYFEYLQRGGSLAARSSVQGGKTNSPTSQGSGPCPVGAPVLAPMPPPQAPPMKAGEPSPKPALDDVDSNDSSSGSSPLPQSGLVSAYPLAKNVPAYSSTKGAAAKPATPKRASASPETGKKASAGTPAKTSRSFSG
jgi:hypothetical protein